MLILIGKSTAGKDTISKELEKLGYNRIVTYTNRPMRDGEVNHVTYHFTDVEDFLTKYIDDFFLEAQHFHTKVGTWFYGSSVQSYIESDENTICILTPSGVRKLKEKGIEYTGVLIDISEDEILRRQELRGDNSTEEKRREAERRFNADKRDFEDINGLIDFCVNNENKSAYDVALEIDSLYRNGGRCSGDI